MNSDLRRRLGREGALGVEMQDDVAVGVRVGDRFAGAEVRKAVRETEIQERPFSIQVPAVRREEEAQERRFRQRGFVVLGDERRLGGRA